MCLFIEHFQSPHRQNTISYFLSQSLMMAGFYVFLYLSTEIDDNAYNNKHYERHHLSVNYFASFLLANQKTLPILLLNSSL